MAGCCCHSQTNELQRPPWLRLTIALVISGLTMTYSLGVNLSPPEGATRWILHSLLAASVLIVLALLGKPIFLQAFSQMRRLRPGLETLFFTGILGAFGASLHSTLTYTGDIYYEVVAILVTIYSIGSTLKMVQYQRAQSLLDDWFNEFKQARLISGDTVPVPTIRTGDEVEIRAGEAITIDGEIISGQAYVTETPLTGEPFPVVKGPGHPVRAGSKNLDGTLHVRATCPGSSRDLDQLLSDLKQARRAPSRLQVRAEKMASLFFPVVCAVSLATFFAWMPFISWQEAMFHALAVVVVACPCALGLATPIAIWSCLGRLSLLSLSVKDPEVIENLARADTVIFDKTGTLTEEQPQRTSFHISPEVEMDWLKSRIASTEQGFEHPLARLSADWKPGPAPHRRALLPGVGIRADYPNETLEIGSAALIEPLGNLSPDWCPPLEDGCRRLYILLNGTWVGALDFQESFRQEMTPTVRALTDRGLQLQVMTGDSLASTNPLTGTDIPVYDRMKPEEKKLAVQTLQRDSRTVIFVGDGINDGPALATAEVGIALASGNPLAKDNADAVLSSTHLPLLAEAVDCCRQTIRTLQQNLWFATGYNLIGMTLAASGILNPVHAALLMLCSSATVSFRALKHAEASAAPSIPQPDPDPILGQAATRPCPVA